MGEAVEWAYGYRKRSIREESTLPGGWGDGFYLGMHQEAYDVELIAIMRGVHHLVSRHEQGKSFTIFPDFQAAVGRLQHDAPGPGQDVARETIELARALQEQGSIINIRWVPATGGSRATS